MMIYYSIKKMKIRLEQECDFKQVENLVRDCFLDVYRPWCLEHYVLHQFRWKPEFVDELDLVMELDWEIIWQSICIKAEIQCDNASILPVLTLWPICISKKYQWQWYWQELLKFVFEKAEILWYWAVLFEWDIWFYWKCGCTYASNYGIRYHGVPEWSDVSFFLCKELKKWYLHNITWVYQTPKWYFVDEKEVEEFDKKFI